MVDLEGKLRLHADLRSEVVRIGAEATPVLVVDNVLSDPQVVIDYAAAHASFTPDVGAYYPGDRSPMPRIYSFALRALLGPVIASAFGLKEFLPVQEKGDFSMVTTPPGELQVLQRMPHIDNTNPKHFAVLHYLCGPDHGGTSFYRHRETGFETIDERRFPIYRKALEDRLASHGPPPAGYALGDDAVFERIASFDSALNRVLVYRGLSLHSADIGPGFRFDRAPRTGRLTANAFYWLA